MNTLVNWPIADDFHIPTRVRQAADQESVVCCVATTFPLCQPCLAVCAFVCVCVCVLDSLLLFSFRVRLAAQLNIRPLRPD